MDLVLPALAVFRFRLFDVQSGDAIPTLRLYLRKTGELGYQHIPRAWTLPDARGYRELRLPGGTYDFRMSSVKTGHAPAVAQGVVVRAKGKPREVDLPMRLGATLHFELAAGEKPIPDGVLLVLVSATKPDEIGVVARSAEERKLDFAPGFHPHFVRDRVFAPGDEARDRVRRLMPGRYLIKSLAPGIELTPSSIVVAEAESRTIQLAWRLVAPPKDRGGSRDN